MAHHDNGNWDIDFVTMGGKCGNLMTLSEHIF